MEKQERNNATRDKNSVTFPPRRPGAQSQRPTKHAATNATKTPAFISKLAEANKVTICNGGKTAVKRMSIRELFQGFKFTVPIFQRRYCWDARHWDTLYGDIHKLRIEPVTGSKKRHSLGRLTCCPLPPKEKNDATSSTASNHSSFCIVDGQQRCTTITLLLAAIRDSALAMKGIDGDKVDSTIKDLVSTIDAILFPDIDEPHNSSENGFSSDQERGYLSEGTQLSYARLIPSYCDRLSYYTAVLSPEAKERVVIHRSTTIWHRPLEAKQHFMLRLGSIGVDDLSSLADCILDDFDLLFFPIDVQRAEGVNDGTCDMQVIYERLALRDATFCRPSRDTEFASMGATDMIRNLLLGSLRREVDKVNLYERYWLPLEQAAASCTEEREDLAMQCMIEAFLESRSSALRDASEKPATTIRKDEKQCQVVGGELYARFQQWLTLALQDEANLAHVYSDDGSCLNVMESRTIALVQLLLEFGQQFLASR